MFIGCIETHESLKEDEWTTTLLSLDKDKILRDAFSKLASKGISSKWAKSSFPITELREECVLLMNNSSFRKELEDYWEATKLLLVPLEMFFNHDWCVR